MPETMCPCCGNRRGCDCADNPHIRKIREHLEKLLQSEEGEIIAHMRVMMCLAKLDALQQRGDDHA